MSTLSLKAKLGRAAVATAALGAALVTLLPTANVQADPGASNALQGVGSDTIEDITNAFAGFSGTQSYAPLNSGAAPGYQQLASWDATGSTCITTKFGGPSFNRPNGSGQGVRALSRALDPAGHSFGDANCGGAKDVSGQVNFARSSSGPSVTGTDLTYIPFARDGVSFAYYRANGSPVTTLTKAQLVSIYTNGPTTINGVLIVPCGIQTQSGTHSFWLSSLGVAATENGATATCNALGTGRLQENDATALKTRGDLVDAQTDGAQVIIGFSAAAWIAKSNLATEDPAPPAGTGIGAISDFGGSPVSGSAPTLTPNANYYTMAGGFGRYVYYVVSTTAIDSGFGNNDLKGLFRGPTSAVCTADATTAKFGFLPLDITLYPTLLDCGDRSTKGGYVAGTI